MKNKTKIKVEKDFIISEVDNRLFGSFLEHMGRAIYTGIYEPTHPSADKNGFRKDVIELIKELEVDIVRYPGGNFLSGYEWTDGIGPKENRPKKLDLAWRTIESNQFGINEFMDWSRKTNVKVMGAVNLGTGTPKDAANLIEYCNFKGGTYWSDLRKEHGYNEPHNIKVWCLGNEMDGPWQICHLDADDYGKKARETAKMMKWIDETIELVVCGSSGPLMPTFPEWDRKVLEYTYDQVDYISLHRYYENFGNDLDFLASFADFDKFIKTIIATVDYVKALKRSNKTINLSFDEWNIWYLSKVKVKDWEEAPEILEDNYSLLDALVMGGLVITLLKNSDRVKMGCLAQLVNVIAPIFTEKDGKAIKQTIFYPFKYFAKYGKGEALTTFINSSKVETKYGAVNEVEAVTVLNKEKKEVTLFVLNINLNNKIDTDIDLNGFGKLEGIEHIILDGDDLHMKNNFENPEAVKPRIIKLDDKKNKISIPKCSFNVLRYKIKEEL
ncbi:alpha-N-arabinofuranosidase [Cetobacterium sp. ZOR0034]|uniref:arabinosylfuranosidase ArfA n=1 Tax=Cetobacterium sp. ZOR0034 TaxID=1339239 RepID=UPI00064694D8|nr:alpha-N-arabinofuranosidase [Cetobacterium sp. ZOR0034]